MRKKLVPAFMILTLILLTSCEPREAPPTQTTNPETVRTETGTTAKPSESQSTTATTSIHETESETTAKPTIDMEHMSSLTFDEAMMFNPYGYAVVGVKTDGVMKYGMIGEDGAFVISPEYDAFRTPKSSLRVYLSEQDIGYTWLEKDGLWGFVNEKCEWVTKPSYEDCTCFTSFGLAGFKKDGQWGFISTSGKIAVDPTFDDVRVDEQEGYAQFKKDGKWGLIDSAGKQVLAPISSSSILTGTKYSYRGGFDNAGQSVALINDRSCLINLNGTVITDDPITVGDIGANLLVYANSPTRGNGYFHMNGELVIPLEDNASGYTFTDDGFAIVSNTEEGTYHFIDGQGNILAGKEFEAASDFAANGLACVKDGNQYGYIDKTGAYAIEPQFDYACSFYDNEIAAVNMNGKWGFIDKTGAYVIEPTYDETSDRNWKDYAYVRKGDRSALVDAKGNLLTDFVFSTIVLEYTMYGEGDEPVFLASDGSGYGLIDARGQWLLAPEYKWITPPARIGDASPTIFCYSDTSYLMTKKDGKFGIVSLQGKVLVEAANEVGYIDVASNGYTVVSSDGKCHYVDLDG